MRDSVLISCLLLCTGALAQTASDATGCSPPPLTRSLTFIEDEALATELPHIEAFWQRCVVTGRFKPHPGGRIELAYAVARIPGDGAAVVIASGRTEHYGKYKEVVYDLWRAGYSVYIHDHRGQGLSTRVLEDPADHQKGHVERFQDYVDDLHAFVSNQTGRHQQRFLLGHSMGGGIGTLYLAQHPGVFEAAAFSSPMHKPNTWPLDEAVCTWSTRPWFWWGSSWFFFKPQPYEDKSFDAKDQIYTRSKARYDAWFRSRSATPDEARIGGVTRQWLREACDASETMLLGASRVRTPLMVLRANGDKAVLPQAQDEFCVAMAQAGHACLPSGTPVGYDDVGHELFIERSPVRNDVMARILDLFGRKRR